MQDIVFKLVPGLYESEDKRRREFYKSRGLVKIRRTDIENTSPQLTSVYNSQEAHHYKYDKQICMCLERYSPHPSENAGFHLHPLLKKFVRCSERTCIFHVVLLLRKKLIIPERLEVDILCGGKPLPSHICLKQVWLSEWYGKPSPLLLYYKVRFKTTDEIEASQ